MELTEMECGTCREVDNSESSRFFQILYDRSV